MAQDRDKNCSDVRNSLKNVYLGATVGDSNEALVLALHSFLLETDFVPRTDGVTEGLCLPEKFPGDFYKFKYYNLSCPSLSCEVTYVPLQNQIAVHGVISDSEIPTESQSIVIPINNYVNACTEFDDVNCVYKNLSDLSVQFKDNFVHKILSEMQHAAGVESTFGLSSLPLDFKFDLLSYLPAKSLVRMSAVNKDFYRIANSSFLWKNLYLQNFPDELPADSIERHKWKELYKVEYTKRVRKEKLARREWLNRQRPGQRGMPYPGGCFIPQIRDPNRDLDFGVGGLAPELRVAFPQLARRYEDQDILFRMFHRPNPWW